MASYTLHLGFNWNSPIIGSIWGKTSDDSYRFLQYALAKAEGQTSAPAWFNFKQRDTLAVVIWDLSSPPMSGTASLQLTFSPLSVGENNITTTLDPNDFVSGDSINTPTQSGNQYLSFTNIGTTAYDQPVQGPWSQARFTYNAGPLTFIGDQYANYKLSFRLSYTERGTLETKIFLSDPEVIVGSRGG